MQNKHLEIAFFDRHAQEQQYNVFSPESNRKIVQACMKQGRFRPGSLVIDLGCGSGVFTHLLQEQGLRCIGLDISHDIMAVGHKANPELDFLTGDVEHLPLCSGSVDGILLSGIIHHLPDPSRCAQEVYRVLRPGGSFAAFDPNRMNPMMWLYRDRSSPLYSNVGVTENERPILAAQTARVFTRAGFRVSTDYLSGLRYRYVASTRLRWLLPLYNSLDDALFRPNWLKSFRAFVLTSGVKP